MQTIITAMLFFLPTSSANPWPNTERVIKEVCELRSPIKGKPVTYGANEYVKSQKGSSFEICRNMLVPRTS